MQELSKEKQELERLKRILNTKKNLDFDHKSIFLNDIMFQLEYLQKTKDTIRINEEKLSLENLKVPSSTKMLLTKTGDVTKKSLKIIDINNTIMYYIQLLSEEEDFTTKLEMVFQKTDLGFSPNSIKLIYPISEKETKEKDLYIPSYRKFLEKPIIDFYNENKDFLKMYDETYNKKKTLPTGKFCGIEKLPLYFESAEEKKEPDYIATLNYDTMELLLYYQGENPSILNYYYFDQPDWDLFSSKVSDYLLISKEELPEDLKEINSWYEGILVERKLDLEQKIKEEKQDSTDKNTKPKIKLRGIKHPTD